jgi:hypothetical protein
MNAGPERRRKIIPIILAAAVFFGIGSPVSGSDVQFWEVFSLDWKTPIKGVKLYLEKQLRYQNTFNDTDSDLTELGIRYRLSGWIDLRANYRYISKFNEIRHRVDGNVVMTWEQPAFELSNRAKIQQEFIQTPEGNETELTLRDMVKATFLPLRDLRPFAAGEIFVLSAEDGMRFDKFRLYAGLEYDIASKVTLSAFYIFQRDVGEKTNETVHIVGARFAYSF